MATDPRPVVLSRQAGSRPVGPWTVVDPSQKLDLRMTLPGAFGWDHAIHVLRVLQAEGAPSAALLPLALPASWLVDSRASSRAFVRWQLPPLRDRWIRLLELLSTELSPQAFREAGETVRVEVAELVAQLSREGEGSSLVAVTKVLATLRPQLVPLMDDAALWFALDAATYPKTDLAPTADARHFLPMMDWFATQLSDNEATLVAVAAGHRRAVLDAAQVLDRLLWFESWGHRYFEPYAKTLEPA